jgi:Tol biopolymer transport system component
MRRLLVVSVLAVLCAPSLRAQRDLTPLDVVTMRTVTGVFPALVGTRIAFTRSEPRLPSDPPGPAYTGLYLLDRDGTERPLAAGHRNIGGVDWWPGGPEVTFLERREGDEGRQLYALDPDDGDPVRVFATELSVGSYRWRPDGGAVAFTASAPAPAARVAARAQGFTQTVVDEDWTPTNLYLWTEDAGVRPLEVPGSVFDLAWSPDGTRLMLALAPRPLTDDSYMFKRLHVLDVASGEVRKLVDNPGKLGSFAWSPDGTRLAYISAADRRDPHAGMLYLADVGSGAVTALTPEFEGMVHDIVWLDDGRIRAVVSRGIESRISDLDVQSRHWHSGHVPDPEMGVLELEQLGGARHTRPRCTP